MIARVVLIVGALLFARSALGQPSIALITEQEAKLPPAPQAVTRGITRGPGIKLLSPERVAHTGFSLKVGFEPRGGAKIDPSTVQVTYLKNPVVDLTSRIQSGIRPDGIDVASVTAPSGDHPIRISVRDDEGRQGSVLIKLSVK